MQTVIDLGRIVRDRKTLPLKVGTTLNVLNISACFYMKLVNKKDISCYRITSNKKGVRIYVQSYKYVGRQVKHVN